MHKEIKREVNQTTSVERDIDQAVARVYRNYGSNLSAFVSDVERQLKQERNRNASQPNKEDKPAKD